MKKWIVTTLVIGGILMIAGSIIGGAEIIKLDGDYTKLDRHEYLDNTYDFDDVFNQVVVDETISNIIINHSEDDVTRFVIKEIKEQEHEISISNNILTVNANYDLWDWWKKGPILQNLVMNIYLPIKDYEKIQINSATGNVKFAESFTIDQFDVNSSTGKVEVEQLTANDAQINSGTGNVVIKDSTIGDANITSSTGDIRIQNLIGNKIEANSSTGDVTMTDSIFDTNVKIRSSTGNIVLEGFDAPNTTISSSTGNVIATLLSGKTFNCSSSTGRVTVPNSIDNGQQFSAHTSTGNINITVI